jgi:DNA-directed RNA polymerase subunit F
MKVIKSRPASIAEVKELLEERKKEHELEYEQAQAAEHAEKFSRWTTSEADKTAEGMVKKGGVDRETAVKLVDISPKYSETLKAIISKNKIEMKDEDAAEIIKQLQK